LLKHSLTEWLVSTWNVISIWRFVTSRLQTSEQTVPYWDDLRSVFVEIVAADDNDVDVIIIIMTMLSSSSLSSCQLNVRMPQTTLHLCFNKAHPVYSCLGRECSLMYLPKCGRSGESNRKQREQAETWFCVARARTGTSRSRF
jgi:hypothetical protein